ncbi:MAG TPA: histidine kinase dimerization/phospho-acceptor domain-containing protein [Pyrinomonadaceae bacterium]|nr:histidine kinase dimerization/phospho-acceptor domain-containing protein [Pyrinomonadaceae bacterium]
MEDTNDTGFAGTVHEMSHELRTPLTSIMGFSELLLEDESLTGQTREYLTIISEESRKLADVLNHYLSILSVESEGRENTESGMRNAE